MTSSSRRWLVQWLAGLVWTLGLASLARAGEPSQRWFSITTPHFLVHYYKSIRHDEAEVAQRVARAAEKAHATLAPLFRYAPRSRTHIVVTDDTDTANGSAAVLPYNLINIFITSPDSRSNLNDHDDWLYTLILHEYVHILHLDTIHGIPRLVNAVMGKVWSPNQLQPRWFTEGLAVYHESNQTSGGRNRASLYDMILRMAVLENTFLEIDQISSPTRVYPRGAVPYLYGGRFLQYLAGRFGEEKLAEIGHRYGGMPIPYAINRVSEQVLGATYVQLYEDFKRHLRRHYERQTRAVKRRGLTESQRVTQHGWSVDSPRYSASGAELLYIASDGRSHAAMRIVDAASAGQKESYRLFGAQAAALTPDGRYVVYGQSVSWRTYHNYHDLYVKRRRDGSVYRLTKGLRARDPDVSPDAQVVFVSNELGSNTLALVPLVGGTQRVLLASKQGEQYFTPRWSPDGRRIVFSHWRSGGRRDISLLEVETGRLQHLTDDRALDMDPQFSADGQRIYFSSDRSGIFNIYCYKLAEGRLRQVTNVLGGAFAPAVSPDERQMYFVGFSSRGYDLHRVELRPRAFAAASPRVDTRPPPAVVEQRPSAYPVRSYSPLRTIWSRSWSFSVGSDVFGTNVGIELDGADAISRHSYLLRLNSSVEAGHFSYAASYSYRRFWPSISLSTSRSVGLRGGVVIDGRRETYVEENYGFAATLGLPVLRLPDHSVSLSVGHRLNWFRDADDTQVLVVPGARSPQLPEVGRMSGVSLRVSYNNVERYAESISSEKGRSIALNLRVDNDALGSHFEGTQLSWSWAEYIDLPWLDDHVLALRYGGGVARGDFKRRGFFAIGGFPEQDVLRAIVDLRPIGGSYLRGYPSGSLFGDQFHLLNVEYRLPIFSLEKGLSSLPVYVNYIHMSLFTDLGDAFFGTFQPEDLKVGVGGELITEWVVGYVASLTLRLGYARGLMEEGGNEFFFLVGNRF